MVDAVSRMVATNPTAEVQSFSSPLIYSDFTDQLERDLVTGEIIALPAALLVMVFVFGGFLAAATPLTGAVASIGGGLAVLYGFSYLVELDQSAVNVVTVLGIGLSIDYGLLIVSRYREELHRRGPDVVANRGVALASALDTAGRTVAFSGIIVATSVGGMVLFAPEIMKGFGGAALGVVTTAMIAALTIVPAVAYLLAPRIARHSVLHRVPGLRRVIAATSNVDRDEGTFARLAAWGQRRPWLIVTAATALLLTLASPVLGLALRNSDIQLLPVGNERRTYVDAFRQGFPTLVDPAIVVYTTASPDALDAWLTTARAVEGVRDTKPAYTQPAYTQPAYTQPASPQPASTQDDATQNGSTQTGVTQNGSTFGGVYLDASDESGAEAAAAVQVLRALPAPIPIFIGGPAATSIDFVKSIATGAPLVIGLVVVVTFVLLFLMTGSLLVPLKTLVINSLSLLSTLGFVVWVFQDGHLEGLLDFQSTGGIETYIWVLILAFGFGLAMDYEVFLLSRVKEYVDRGFDNDAAVRAGLQRSGRIITSAAAVIVLVFLGFAFGKLLMIKEIGVGLAFAVLLDATVVRMFLVPATMSLLGEWNWWAPGPLRRWHERHGFSH